MRIIKKLAVSIFAIAVFFGIFYFYAFPWYFSIKEPYFAMPVIYPGEVRNDAYGEGSFGAKRKGKRVHEGLDLSAPLKSPVYASKSGWARVLHYPTGYGNLVIINHPGGWQTRYGHLKSVAIKKSQWVKQEEVIGSVGKTGNAAARGIKTHLHFEIRHKSKALDPAEFLVRKDKN
ncbi:MAG: M23 family metallopeptidase [Candidatus Omnitrophica bacterium]|nr:M23 family metallopeptidase [Candidatus Omnitrophota bacterium]